MSPEAQRIAIAEALDWTFHPYREDDGLPGWQRYKEEAVMCWVRPGGESWQRQELPDFLNDLNAMHAAEKVLTLGQQKDYLSLLAGYFCGAVGYEWEDGYALAIMATASQRAEALLRILNLWKEVE